MKTVTTRIVARALRAEGHTVVTGRIRLDDMSNFWVIGEKGTALVLNCQTFSILGHGCIHHPDYTQTRDALVATAKRLLDAAGIEYRQSPNPDQLFLSNYASQNEHWT
jgi:diphthamide synthase subunit DPH2